VIVVPLFAVERTSKFESSSSSVFDQIPLFAEVSVNVMKPAVATVSSPVTVTAALLFNVISNLPLSSNSFSE
jgi:hypothetical protein